MSLIQFNETYKPFHYPWAVELARDHEQIHWVEDEIELQEDVTQWKRELTTEQKNMITHILRLFTQSDVAVGQIYYNYLIPFFKNNEIRNMLGSFASREAIHQRAYALLNDTLGLPDSEYQAFLEYKEMSDKWEAMTDPVGQSMTDVATILARTVFLEGVSLFASFIMLKNFERTGHMKGMCKVVEWSIRDETVHVEGNAQLFRAFISEHPRVLNKNFRSNIISMSKNIVELEDRFIDLAFEMGDLDNLSKVGVKQYVRYITDRRLIQMGFDSVFNVRENPLPWVGWVIGDNQHTNFFEQRVTDYSKAGMTGSWPWEVSDVKE